MIKINCPVKLCKSTNTVYSYKFKNLKYFKCNECTTYFQNPLPQNIDYKKKYNKEYFESYQKLSIKTSKLKYICVIVFYSSVMSSLSLLGKNSNEILNFLIIIPIIGQMLHFYIDSQLWKFSNPHNRKNVLNFII